MTMTFERFLMRKWVSCKFLNLWKCEDALTSQRISTQYDDQFFFHIAVAE